MPLLTKASLTGVPRSRRINAQAFRVSSSMRLETGDFDATRTAVGAAITISRERQWPVREMTATVTGNVIMRHVRPVPRVGRID
jgi:hypothetical protein